MNSTERHFDAIVIGSGPAGSTAVKELTERGLEVLLLDAGRELRDEDFVPLPHKKVSAMGMDVVPRAKAMLAGQFRQACRPYFSAQSNRFLVNDAEDPYTTPLNHPYLWVRSKLLGGRMHSYGRVLQRMSDADFRAASRDGYGNDWPIDYAELSPWYDHVEGFYGVYGNDDGLSHPPTGKYVGPGFLTRVEQDFKTKVESAFPERKVIAWRTQAPFLDRTPPGIAAAKATGRLTIRTEAEVTRIVTDQATGLATGVLFVDRNTKAEHRAFADVVMVCASTIESVRLLLNSGSTRHPAGLGNSSGVLGHYFMDQTISVGFFDAPRFQGVWDSDPIQPRDPFYGTSGGILIPRYDNLDGRHDESFLRGVSYQGLGGRFPVPADSGAAFGLGGSGEMLARYDNQITLSRVKDKWGMPVPHIDLSMGENDRLLLERTMKHLREMADVAGLRVNFIGSLAGLESKKVWPDFNPVQRLIFKQGIKLAMSLGAAIHECGGARMGADPSMSVVNAYGQVWDAPNVFVADGATFVNSSTVGPALTVMALAARTSHHIADRLADGSITKA